MTDTPEGILIFYFWICNFNTISTIREICQWKYLFTHSFIYYTFIILT